MNCENCYELLTSEQVIAGLGFVYGASQNVNFNKETLKAPGMTFLSGLYIGAVYAGGFGYLASMCPRPYRAVLGVALVASIGYYQYKNFGVEHQEVE